jgi:hypothetical protein
VIRFAFFEEDAEKPVSLADYPHGMAVPRIIAKDIPLSKATLDPVMFDNCIPCEHIHKCVALLRMRVDKVSF